MTYDKQYAKEVLGADCDHCPLNRGSKFVPSAGPKQADLAFVGEAPGVQEARNGVPFVGPSGRLLEAVNSQYGIKREEVFLSNACLCRPNDGGNPPELAVAACRSRLHRELHERNVTTVVALGNKASRSLLGVEGVTKLRVGPGRTSPYEALSGIRIIPTVHPAACLRQSDMFPSLVADVGKVVNGNVTWVEPRFRVFDDPLDAVRVLRELEARAGDLVVDIEVDIEKDASYDHPDRYGLLSAGLGYEEGRAVVIGERALADDAVRDALGDALRASRLIGQNGKFDLAGLYPVLGPLELYFDTMLASYALDERPSIHGLKQMAVEHLGAPQYNVELDQYVKGPTTPELEHYSGYGRIPRDILYKYNAYDVVCTFALYKLFEKKLAASKQPSWWEENIFGKYEFKSLRELHDFLVEAGNELKYLELNGIPVDRQYSYELQTGYLEVLGEIEAELNGILTKAGYQPINPRSVPQVKKALNFFLIYPESTNADTLHLIMEKGEAHYGDQIHEMDYYNFCRVLLRHRDEAKQYSTYVKGILKRCYRGRIHPTFNIHGTTTGRLASRNPNAQNIPRRKKIKAQFIPGKPENVWVQADYSQAELRVLTWMADEPFFREILNDPARDLFDELTPRLYPTLPSKEEMVLMRPEEWKDIRVRVKAFVYGLGYGRTHFSIAHEYRMPVQEAKMMADNFTKTIPSITAWQERVQGHVKSGRDLINPFGRHRRFHLITDENWNDIKKEALAFLPQSTSSDITLRAMVRLRRELRGSGAFIRNIVHDSILVDTPPDMVNDVSTLLDQHMVASAQELVGDYIQFRTDVSVGKNWGECA